MDQLITNPLKRFLYNTKEFAKKQAYKYNNSDYNSIDDGIRMSDIKSIMRSPSKLNKSSNVDEEDKVERVKNNVLFDESADKINNSDLNENKLNSINLNKNTVQRVTVKVVEQPAKESIKYLELNNTNLSCKSDLDNNQFNQFAQVTEIKTQTPSVIKIKVKVPKGTLNKNDNQKFEINLDHESINVNHTENNCNTENKTNILEINNDKLINITELNTNIQKMDLDNIDTIKNVEINNSENQINISNNNKQIEKTFDESKHNVDTGCIFDENRTRPLSPIPVVEPTDIRFHFRAVEDLINFHEKLMQTSNKMTHSKQPLMGTSALVHRSPPYEQKKFLDDSEIVSALVRDRFIVNMYETRSYRRSQVKKPSRYGRVYRSLERSVGIDTNIHHKNTQKNTTINDSIVAVKQSSPIQFKDQFVSLNPKSVTGEESCKKEEISKPTLDLHNLISEETMQKFVQQPSFTEDKKKEETRKLSEETKDQIRSVMNTTQDSVNQPIFNENKKKDEIRKPIEETKDQHFSEMNTTQDPVNQQFFIENKKQDEIRKHIEETKNEVVSENINQDIVQKPLLIEEINQEPQTENHFVLKEEQVFENNSTEGNMAAAIIERHGEEFNAREEATNCSEKQELESISSHTDSEIDANSVDNFENEELKKPASQMESIPDQVASTSEDSLLKLLGSDTDVSYNMDDFLEKALGEELCNYSNLDSTTEMESKIEKNKIVLNSILQEDSVCTSDASDLVSKINTIQSNFYRSLTKKLQHMSDTLRFPLSPKKEKDADDSKYDNEFDTIFPNNEEVTDLVCQAAVQLEAMKQITKALVVCRNMKEFTVSSEQVEGERLLLVATYKRQAILDEIRRLDYELNDTIHSTETGTILISDVTLPLKASNTEQVPTRRDQQQWYVGIFSYGPQVFATQPTLATPEGNVRFSEEILFTELPSEFTVNVEVYSLLQRRMGRNFSHESKYHINKGIKSTHCPTPKKLLHREKQLQKIPTRFDNGIRTSSFKLSGCLKLNVADLSKANPWLLRKVPLCSLLDGSIRLQLQSFVHIPVKHSGFLNIGTEAGGCASWNRRWCILQGHILRYWNYPVEEDACEPLREIDLKYCINPKIGAANRALCAKPKTLMIEIAQPPKSEEKVATDSCAIERHFLSVDTISELRLWENQLNIVVTAIRTWNVGYLN